MGKIREFELKAEAARQRNETRPSYTAEDYVQRAEQYYKELQKLPRVSGSGALGNVYVSNRVNAIFNAANNEMRQLKDEYVSTEHLLIAIADEKGGKSAEILNQQGVNKNNTLNIYSHPH